MSEETEVAADSTVGGATPPDSTPPVPPAVVAADAADPTPGTESAIVDAGSGPSEGSDPATPATEDAPPASAEDAPASTPDAPAPASPPADELTESYKQNWARHASGTTVGSGVGVEGAPAEVVDEQGDIIAPHSIYEIEVGQVLTFSTSSGKIRVVGVDRATVADSK